MNNQNFLNRKVTSFKRKFFQIKNFLDGFKKKIMKDKRPIMIYSKSVCLISGLYGQMK